MRIAVLVLGVLGGLLCGALGMTWISNYNEALELSGTVAELEAMGADMSEVDAAMAGVETQRNAGYVLLLGLVLGIVGGVMAFKGNGKVGGGLMLAAPVIAAAMDPGSLIFSFLLVIGGGLAFMVKAGGDAPAAAHAPVVEEAGGGGEPGV